MFVFADRHERNRIISTAGPTFFAPAWNAPSRRRLWYTLGGATAIAGSAAASGWLRATGGAEPWSWLALIPLLAAIRIARPPVAAFAGSLWGASFFLGSAAAPEGNAAALLTLIAWVVIPTLYAWLGALSVRRVGFHPLVLAVGWMLVELAVISLGPQRGILMATTPESGTLSDAIARHFGCVLVCFLWALINSIVVSTAAVVVQALANIRSLRTGNRPADLLPLLAIEWREKWFGGLPQARAPPSLPYDFCTTSE